MKVKVVMDGQEATVSPGTTILELAQSLGIAIPTLCHHPAMEPYGVCRVCTVEVTIGTRRRFVTACNFPLDHDAVVSTASQEVKLIRRTILELLLARCPSVDPLRALAKEYGVEDTPFAPGEEDCILCGLCVQVCDQMVGAQALCFAWRGAERRVTTPFEAESDTCIACGACAYLCPTQSKVVDMEAKALQRLLKRPGAERPCRYTLMGFHAQGTCSRGYRCAGCEVDQAMMLLLGSHPALSRPR